MGVTGETRLTLASKIGEEGGEEEGGGADVTMAGQTKERTNEQTRKDRATQPMDHGRLK